MAVTDEQPPTQLARPVDATEASLAWAIDTTPEVVAYRPPWVARTAVAAALVLIAGAGVVALTMTRDQPVVSAEPTRADSSPIAAGTTAPTSTPRETPPAPRPSSAPPPTSRAPIETAAMRKPPPPPEPTLAPPLWTVAHDAEFIAALRADGWSIWDEAAMANNAHYVCTWLRNGDTPVRATSRLNGITTGEAWSITQTAMAVYPNCP